MANSLITPVQVVRKSLAVLHNNLVFTKGVNRQYAGEFGRTGAKIGSTVNIRKPNQYFVRTGAAASVQNTSETYVPLTLSTQYGVDVAFSSAELTLSLDDFADRILTPAMAKIASKIDFDGLGQYKYVNNVIGTPGTTPGTSGGSAVGLAQYNAPIVYLNAGMMLDNGACPRDAKRRVVINPAAMAQSVQGLSGLFNSQQLVSEQYRAGVLGEALGFEFAMDQNINTHSRGTAVAGDSRVQATNVGTGETTIVFKTGTGTLKQGDVFTVANVYAVNPENQTSTGQLQQFVVTADKTLAGTADSVSVYPAVVLSDGGVSVANGTVTRVPTADDVITIVGTASTTFAQNLAYHQDAFTFATADLEMPSGVDFAARETYDGISMRVVRAYDVNNDAFICRIDVLAGWATLRPELACRIVG